MAGPAHRETRIDPIAHAVVKGEREFWCQAPRCDFTATVAPEASAHAASRQYDATHLPPIADVVTSSAIIRGSTSE